MDEREVVGRELVVARADPPTPFYLVEKPLDQVAGTVEIRAEADWAIAIALWWDVGPYASLGSKGSDPVGVISSVCEHHCPRLQAG